jgi:hypothetical protein
MKKYKNINFVVVFVLTLLFSDLIVFNKEHNHAMKRIKTNNTQWSTYGSEHSQINQHIAKHLCRKYDNFMIECVDLNRSDFSYIELPQFPKSLELAIFTGNYLDQIREPIFKTNISIQLLNLSSNKIKSICSTAFSNLNRLSFLSLDFNYLNMNNGFDFMLPISETLISLSLTSAFDKTQSSSNIYNQIIEMFNQSKLVNLKNLSLSDNNLATFDLEYILCRFKKLKILSLHSNLLEHIGFDLNKCNSNSLIGLDLRYNNISYVNKEFIQSLENLYLLNNSFRVALSHNPFKCDCNLLDFHLFLRRSNPNILIDSSLIMCSHPNSIKSTFNKPIINSKLDSICRTQI